MLGLSAQSFTYTAAPLDADAIQRALEIAGTVSGGYAGEPCTFVPLAASAARLLAPLRPTKAPVGIWVLVTAPTTREEDHRVHLRERTLTAAQRFMLALACDGLDGRWVADSDPPYLAETLQAAGVALDGRDPVGLVWCADE